MFNKAACIDNVNLFSTNFPQAKSTQFSGPQARIVAAPPARKTWIVYGRFETRGLSKNKCLFIIYYSLLLFRNGPILLERDKPIRFEALASLQRNDCCILVQEPESIPGFCLSRNKIREYVNAMHLYLIIWQQILARDRIFCCIPASCGCPVRRGQANTPFHTTIRRHEL